MTIFRSDLIEPEKLEYQFVSANDPDIIGVEVMLNGKVLIDGSMDPDGLTSVVFDQDGVSMEFDLTGLRHVLDKCERELVDWRKKLIVTGEIWDPDQ